MLQRTSTHTWISSIFLFLSVLSFYLCFFVENLYPWSGPLYHLWYNTMTQKRVWLIFILCFWQNTALDMMFSRWRYFRRQLVEEEFLARQKTTSRVIEASESEEEDSMSDD